MADTDDSVMPLHGWSNVLEQLSLPLRAYQQQLIRTYQPALRFGEQLWHAYGGWLRYWERFAYWERLVVVEGSAFEAPDWGAQEATSTTSPATTRSEGRPAFALGAELGQLPEAGRTMRPGASRDAGNIGVPPEAERILADLAWVLEVVGAQLEHLMSSLNGLLAEQVKLLSEAVTHRQEGMPGHEEKAEDQP
ncbi:MAG: hypothetical protein M3252_03270 [Actinomycetota bacterium]|nr:hypothetical protein [Actinomycetota bacterium]